MLSHWQYGFLFSVRLLTFRPKKIQAFTICGSRGCQPGLSRISRRLRRANPFWSPPPKDQVGCLPWKVYASAYADNAPAYPKSTNREEEPVLEFVASGKRRQMESLNFKAVLSLRHFPRKATHGFCGGADIIGVADQIRWRVFLPQCYEVLRKS